MSFTRFQPSMFEFLEQLRTRNERAWFEKNKDRYEQEVREPALAFIRSFEPQLKKLSEFFVASDRKVGGSLMRVHRDTRFSKNKQPYKTNVGIQFRHQMGKDVHAPGYYVHIEPGACFLGVGIWHPDNESLARIREAIAEGPARWKRGRDHKAFGNHFQLAGDSLTRPPRGFAAEHPMVEDLKRKDFIGVCQLEEKDVLAPKFLQDTAGKFAAARPFMQFLCDALKVPF